MHPAKCKAITTTLVVSTSMGMITHTIPERIIWITPEFAVYFIDYNSWNTKHGGIILSTGNGNGISVIGSGGIATIRFIPVWSKIELIISLIIVVLIKKIHGIHHTGIYNCYSTNS